MKFKAQLFVVNSSDWEFEGRKGTKHEAQMLITSSREEEGKQVEHTFVARLKIGEHLKDTPPGEYLTELRPFADSKGNLDFAVAAFIPYGRPAANAKSGAAVAA
ncbi:hypothetical protein ACUXAV_006131 [Cupriavidus metallidurans]|uniref:hypothetical protein n=1 Tax=Cupriavidus metallidurans TaxID=119219 RepID=UPI00049303EC|nr:hypothetical protein [Cupriavidus metallidurans]MDE4920190.1 hypothetical protein [Cupriavidus metallidurans]